MHARTAGMDKVWPLSPQGQETPIMSLVGSQHAGNSHVRNAVVTIAVVLRHGVASKFLPTISLVPSAALPAL